jgi:hypothetical protein
MPHDALHIGPHVLAAPVIHGSGDFAWELRRLLLAHRFDCVAVPLPPSFQQGVEEAIDLLPRVTLVAQRHSPRFGPSLEDSFGLPPGEESGHGAETEDELPLVSYVPIDPCQPVIAALRTAIGEHIPRAFLDVDSDSVVSYSAVLPDPYALKHTTIERFAAAVLPSIPPPPSSVANERIAHMAARLHELEQRYHSILLVCSLLDWPWIREAYHKPTQVFAPTDEVEPVRTYAVDPQTLLFVLGELPFITRLYEEARATLESDEHLSIDGVKQLLLAARDSYRTELKRRARRITPQRLSSCLKYVRNLLLMDRRMTPDLYSLVVAAKQVAGDQFALHVAEKAREYEGASQSLGAATDSAEIAPPQSSDSHLWLESLTAGIGKGRLPDGEVVRMVNRLPGHPIAWRRLDLVRRPDRRQRERWQMKWNPYGQCSWPPEDDRIESFRSHVFDRARLLMQADQVQTEKFTTSVRDGIDVRETLRHWYEGDIWVKVLPPSRGTLDAAVMLFDSPADPRDYPWRTTWYAEHDEESTLAFYASDYRSELVGPGIAVATYGGALFLYPPVAIRDIWHDPSLDFTETLEERLLAAACLHSQSRQIVLVSPGVPGAGWRRLARRFKKTWIHVPLSGFGDETIQQLRMVHVLNGRQVRSYAERFLRRI